MILFLLTLTAGVLIGGSAVWLWIHEGKHKRPWWEEPLRPGENQVSSSIFAQLDRIEAALKTLTVGQRAMLDAERLLQARLDAVDTRIAGVQLLVGSTRDELVELLAQAVAATEEVAWALYRPEDVTLRILRKDLEMNRVVFGLYCAGPADPAKVKKRVLSYSIAGGTPVSIDSLPTQVAWEDPADSQSPQFCGPIDAPVHFELRDVSILDQVSDPVSGDDILSVDKPETPGPLTLKKLRVFDDGTTPAAA